MIKYAEHMVTFAEIPTEVSLSFNITNCQNRCVGCHSPHLREDTGEELTDDVFDSMIASNKGITCVLFLGEGNDQERLFSLADRARNRLSLKTAVYSGRTDVERSSFERHFDYVKIGPYIEEYGPLNRKTTNQRLFLVSDGAWSDMTPMFWKE